MASVEHKLFIITSVSCNSNRPAPKPHYLIFIVHVQFCSAERAHALQSELIIQEGNEVTKVEGVIGNLAFN